MQPYKINHFIPISIIFALLISFLFSCVYIYNFQRSHRNARRSICSINDRIHKIIIPLFVLILVMGVSCNLTKNVPKGEQLLVKNKVEITNKHFSEKESGFHESDIEQILKPQTNAKFIGMPIKLMIYNLANEKKTNKKFLQNKNNCEEKKNKKLQKISKKLRIFDKKNQNLSSDLRKYKRYAKKISRLQNKSDDINRDDCNKKHWTRRLGEAPVIFKINDRYRNKNKIKIFLKEKGFYDSDIQILTRDRKFNNKKVKAFYKISLKKVHKISDIRYEINDENVKNLILNDTMHSLLIKGNRLDIKVLENERSRIMNYLRTKGYYNFTKDFISYSADTISKKMHDKLFVFLKKDSSEISTKAFKRYIIKNVFIYPYFEAQNALTNKDSYYSTFDTLIYYDKKDVKYYFLYNKMPRINPKAIVRGIYIKPDKLFNLKDVNATYRYLASLPIIQIANVKFSEIKSDKSGSDTVAFLNCEIRLTQSKLKSTNASYELTNTSGNFGIGGDFSFTHNNIFRNAGVLNIGTKVAFKRLTKNKAYLQSDSTSFFNRREYGINFSLDFPRLMAPVPMKRFFKKRNPKTIISANYNFLSHPDYTYTVAGGNIAYSWNSTQTIGHIFSPVTADVVDLRDATEEFLDRIRILQLKNVYETHFVLGSSYKFIFNNQFNRNKKNSVLLMLNTKIAGNSLTLLMKGLDKKKVDNSYVINDIVFAQFVKEDIEFRFHKKLLRENDKIAFRFFAGAAFPYGNLKVIPFGERYSVGGANSIRAWHYRLLGPGSYVPNDSIEQTADIRLEANIEYRMKLFWKLEGALFVDAGNIWSINNQDIRPGALFDFNTFYKEIAVGTGYGLRFDLGFVLLRADMGFKLIDPSLPLNHRWIYGNRKFSSDDWTLYLAIGYPF